jgi:hypothetical protein
MSFAVNGSPRMEITSGGNVSIGTSGDAGYKLTVSGNNSSGYLGITNQTAATGDRFLRIGFGSGHTYATIQGTRLSVADDVPLALQAGGGNVLIGTTTDAGYKLDVNGTGRFQGTLQSDNATTAELRLRGGGYAGNYNTSLKSVVGAIGILQFGNNADNYILVGNTAAGGYLDVRVNVSTESTTSGTLALRIAANATATFYSSVTATSFFESSDSRLKTLITDNYQVKGIESVIAKLYTKNGREELGYYAQDVQGILPSAVSKGKDGLLSLSYREVLVAKVQRTESEIDKLKKRVAELEQQLNFN